MSGPDLLIIVIILVFVIAFVITVLLLNDGTKKILSTNAKLVENQNALLDQNKRQEDDKKRLESQINELEEQLKQKAGEEVALLREQTRQYRENIELTADMNDEDLTAWLDQKMDKTRLYTDRDLTLKIMANALGLTQRRLGALFKNNPKYARNMQAWATTSTRNAFYWPVACCARNPIGPSRPSERKQDSVAGAPSRWK